MKFKILALMLLTLASHAIAQVSPLKIGDKLPENLICEMTGPTPEVNLSSFKGKLLILDFWATWCSPCVAMIPKMDSLQKAFNGKVQFIPITSENSSAVNDFAKRMQSIKGIGLSSVINDEKLSELLIHSSIPFYVWLDQQGKIIATTEGAEVNAKNIKNAINGTLTTIESIVGHKKKEVDIHKPMFNEEIAFLDAANDSSIIKEPVKIKDILYRSVISKYIPNLTSGLSWDSIHFTASNCPVLNIYRLFFGLKYRKDPYLFWSKSRCVIEIKDSTLANRISSDLDGSQYEHWLESNGYNYELIWSSEKSWMAKRALLEEDLNTHFSKPLGISAALEKRMAPADILVLNGSNKFLKTDGGSPYERHDAFSYKQQNMPLSRFIYELEGYFWQRSDRAVFDETKFKQKVDLELNCKMTDISAVNKELEKYGLRFQDGNRPTDVLVIRQTAN